MLFSVEQKTCRGNKVIVEKGNLHDLVTEKTEEL